MKKFLLRLRHWTDLALGRSYWHVPQRMGRVYRPGELHGYFNDVTLKTNFLGTADAQGIPLLSNHLTSGFYHPITICNKALGHWDCHLLGDSSQPHLEHFWTLVNKLVALQDEHGGWRLDTVLGIELASPYSAMAQGQALSVLARAHRLEPESRLLGCGRRALARLLLPVAAHGTVHHEDGAVVLEEYCWAQPNTILNGWIFGIYGLYDWQLLEPSLEVGRVLEETVASLAAWLPRFDMGHWSYYDTARDVASPFYHEMHVAQLTALSQTFPRNAAIFAHWRDRFAADARHPLRRWRAVAHKVAQKLSRPPEALAR